MLRIDHAMSLAQSNLHDQRAAMQDRLRDGLGAVSKVRDMAIGHRIKPAGALVVLVAEDDVEALHERRTGQRP